MAYDAQGDLISMSEPDGNGAEIATTTYSYDADGERTSVTTPDGNLPGANAGNYTAVTRYNADGQTNSVTKAGGSGATFTPRVTSYVYDADVGAYTSNGQLASQTTGAGTAAASTTSYCYDPDGNVTSAVAPDGNVPGVAPCETTSPWLISANSYPTQAAHQTVSRYDSAGQLVSITRPAASADPNGAVTSFTYGPTGNLLTSAAPDGVVTSMTYNPANLTTGISYSGSTAPSVSYSYDAQRNITAITDGTGSSSYSYDPFGELTAATNGAGQAIGYSYDADGDTTGVSYPLPATATWANTDTVGYGYDHNGNLSSITDFNGNQINLSNGTDNLPSAAALGSTGDTLNYTYDQGDDLSAIALNSGGRAYRPGCRGPARRRAVGDRLGDPDRPG
jgi:YD repeat-containing protein